MTDPRRGGDDPSPFHPQDTTTPGSLAGGRRRAWLMILKRADAGMLQQRRAGAPSCVRRSLGLCTPATGADKRATSVNAILKALRLAEYDILSGPVRYHGGPVEWETGKPLNPGLVTA